MTEADALLIAEALGRTRGELEARIDKLEHVLSIERRIAALETHAGGAISDTKARLEHGLPIGEREGLAFVQRMQNRDMGDWTPAHASWRGSR